MTIIRNIEDDSIVMFDSDDASLVYYLDNSEDNTWLYDEDEGTLEPTSGWYSDDDLCGLHLVMREGLAKEFLSSRPSIIISGERFCDLLPGDVSKQSSVFAVEIPCGKTFHRYIYDSDGSDAKEKGLEYEIMYELSDVSDEFIQRQDYPHKHEVREYVGYADDDTMIRVRETRPFDDEQKLPTYEIVPLRDISGDIVVRFEWQKHVGYARKFLGIEKVKSSDACHDESLLRDDDLAYTQQYMSVLSADVVEECEKDGTLEQVLLDELINGRDMKWSNPKDVVKAIEEFCNAPSVLG